MSVLTLPTCPTDCTGALPDVAFNDCSPDYHWGEISKLYIASSEAADFTNPDIITEWTARLSDTSDDPDAVREFDVMGELASPEKTETPVTGGNVIYSQKTFTLTAEVLDTNDTNYNFLLNTECNMKFKVWYETSDGMLYGGQTGILAPLNMDNPIPKSREELVKFVISIKWKSLHHPLRCQSPMF